MSGWRHDRQDSFWSRRLPSQVANALISWITGVRLHDYGCALKVYRREILQDVALYGEMHRFLPALCRWVGATVGELPVSHWPRRRGVSKYGLGRTGTGLAGPSHGQVPDELLDAPDPDLRPPRPRAGGPRDRAGRRAVIPEALPRDGAGQPPAPPAGRTPCPCRLPVRVDWAPGRDARPDLSRVTAEACLHCPRNHLWRSRHDRAAPVSSAMSVLASPSSCRRGLRGGQQSSSTSSSSQAAADFDFGGNNPGRRRRSATASRRASSSSERRDFGLTTGNNYPNLLQGQSPGPRSRLARRQPGRGRGGHRRRALAGSARSWHRSSRASSSSWKAPTTPPTASTRTLSNNLRQMVRSRRPTGRSRSSGRSRRTSGTILRSRRLEQDQRPGPRHRGGREHRRWRRSTTA